MITAGLDSQKKAVIIASVVSHVGNFCKDDLTALQGLGYRVCVACNFTGENACSPQEARAYRRWLTEKGIDCRQIDFERSPRKLRSHFSAYRQLKNLLASAHFDLVHCHTPIAGVFARFAARKYRKSGTRVIYTAHGFHFFKGASLARWALFYPIERLCSRWTDLLITINHEDYALAVRKMHAAEIVYLPGVGVDLARFSPSAHTQTEKETARAALGLREGDKFLLSVGELTPRKNHALVLRALALLNDPRVFYFICGCGGLQPELTALAASLGLGDRVRLLGYRTDIALLDACADLFVFPSRQEGLPVALMEAVASQTPTVCSRIRGNTDLVEQGALFSPDDPAETAAKIKQYLYGDHASAVAENYRGIRQYSRENVDAQMLRLYRQAVPNAREDVLIRPKERETV